MARTASSSKPKAKDAKPTPKPEAKASGKV